MKISLSDPVLWLVPYLYLVAVAYYLGFWGPFTVEAFTYYDVTDLVKGMLGSIIPILAATALVTLLVLAMLYAFYFKGLHSRAKRYVVATAALGAFFVIPWLLSYFIRLHLNVGMWNEHTTPSMAVGFVICFALPLLVTYALGYLVFDLTKRTVRVPVTKVETNGAMGTAVPATAAPATETVAEIAASAQQPMPLNDAIRIFKLAGLFFLCFTPCYAFMVGKKNAWVIKEDFGYSYVLKESLAVPEQCIYKYLGKAGSYHILLTRDNNQRLFVPLSEFSPLVLGNFSDQDSASWKRLNSVDSTMRLQPVCKCPGRMPKKYF